MSRAEDWKIASTWHWRGSPGLPRGKSGRMRNGETWLVDMQFREKGNGTTRLPGKQRTLPPQCKNGRRLPVGSRHGTWVRPCDLFRKRNHLLKQERLLPGLWAGIYEWRVTMRNIVLCLTYLGNRLPWLAGAEESGHCGRDPGGGGGSGGGAPGSYDRLRPHGCGVHARVYVANFRTDSTIPCDRLPYALNTHLPPDVVVSQAREVHEGLQRHWFLRPQILYLPHLQ